jgi:hypothetical protein
VDGVRRAGVAGILLKGVSFMSEINRRTLLHGLGATIALAPGMALRAATVNSAVNPHLTKVNPKFLVSEQEIHAWHVAKDSMGGPTMTGSPSWKNYLEILEKGLRECGVVDIFRNPFNFTRRTPPNSRTIRIGRCTLTARRSRLQTTAAIPATRREMASRASWWSSKKECRRMPCEAKSLSS